MKGALAIAANAGRNAVDASASGAFSWSQTGAGSRTGLVLAARGARGATGANADGKIVWSWRPYKGVEPGRRAIAGKRRRRWQVKPTHRGERDISRLKSIAR